MRWFERQNEKEKMIYPTSIKQEVTPKKSLQSINKIINERERKNFIRKLFQNDPVQFDNFIMNLEGIKEWNESFQFVETELARRMINQNCEDAQRLTNLVFRRFYPE